MNATSSIGPSQRLLSLDVFRGITIAGMILVNNPGSWAHVYGPLRHAEWNGWTPTDLVFPFFLFIVGVAMTFSFDRRVREGHSRRRLLAHVVRRAAIIFLLGLTMHGFPDWRLIGPCVLVITGLSLAFADGAGQPPRAWLTGSGRNALGAIALGGGVLFFALDFAYFQESAIRVPGVLQRIAVCYLLASVVVLTCGIPGRAAWTAVCIIVYWMIVKLVPAPTGYSADVASPDGLLHNWIDEALLGNHLYGHRPDPEGILSTLPSVATTLLGALTGNWLTTAHEPREKVIGLFFAANVALVAGLYMDIWFPINKKIWTSSYVVFMAGLALHLLAMCYWLLDIRQRRSWSWPFIVFGTNAIVVYVASSLAAKMMYRWKLPSSGGTSSVKTWIYENFFASWAGPLNGSLLFALAFVAVWLLPMIPLYRKRIFIKV